MTTLHRSARSADTTAVAAPVEPDWVMVSRQHEDDPDERPVNRRRVLIQVVVGALVVLLLVTISGTIASRKLAEKTAVNDAAKTANVLAESVIQPALTNELLTGDPEAVAQVDSAVRQFVLGASSVRVKIWSSDGDIVYSDEKSLIGKHFPLVDEQLEVLQTPTTKAEITDLDRPENRFEESQGKLLEVYRPVWTPNGTPLLFETYAPYDNVTDRSTELWRGFAGITMSSLLALIVLLLPILWRLLDNERRSRAHREGLLRRAVDASSDERRRIAGTLHDGVVQELAATNFAVSSAAARAEVAGQRDLAADLRQTAATVRTTIGGLRSLLVDIYPPSLASSGLTAALEDLAATLRLRGVEVALDVPVEDVLGLDLAKDRLIYRVAQECLLNTARHGRARRAWLQVRRLGHYVILEVRDDGIGFDARQAIEDPDEGHFGLRVLGDVAAEEGADLRVASAPGQGTCWQLRVAVS